MTWGNEWLNVPSSLGRFVKVLPKTSLGFRGHLITNFPHVMVLLIISRLAVAKEENLIPGFCANWTKLNFWGYVLITVAALGSGKSLILPYHLRLPSLLSYLSSFQNGDQVDFGCSLAAMSVTADNRRIGLSKWHCQTVLWNAYLCFFPQYFCCLIKVLCKFSLVSESFWAVITRFCQFQQMSIWLVFNTASLLVETRYSAESILLMHAAIIFDLCRSFSPWKTSFRSRFWMGDNVRVFKNYLWRLISYGRLTSALGRSGELAKFLETWQLCVFYSDKFGVTNFIINLARE